MFLRVSRFVSIAAIFALCVIHNVRPVFAQVSGATLSGVVHDESQTPVGKAKVVVRMWRPASVESSQPKQMAVMRPRTCSPEFTRLPLPLQTFRPKFRTVLAWPWG